MNPRKRNRSCEQKQSCFVILLVHELKALCILLCFLSYSCVFSFFFLLQKSKRKRKEREQKKNKGIKKKMYTTKKEKKKPARQRTFQDPKEKKRTSFLSFSFLSFFHTYFLSLHVLNFLSFSLFPAVLCCLLLWFLFCFG